MKTEIPVACYLTDIQLPERRKIYLEKAAESLMDSAELSDGCVFRFRLGESMLEDPAKII